jgi:hypothetical protein
MEFAISIRTSVMEDGTLTADAFRVHDTNQAGGLAGLMMDVIAQKCPRGPGFFLPRTSRGLTIKKGYVGSPAVELSAPGS